MQALQPRNSAYGRMGAAAGESISPKKSVRICAGVSWFGYRVTKTHGEFLVVSAVACNKQQSPTGFQCKAQLWLHNILYFN